MGKEKKQEDVQCCYSLGHGITCHSFNQGLSANCHIRLQSGKRKILTQTKSSFGNIFDTNIFYFTRWSDRGLWFSRIPRGDVIGYRLRFDNMSNEEVEPFVFCFIYSNINYIVYKITNANYFFSSIGCLIKVLRHLYQKMHTRIPKYGVLV